MSTPMNAPFFTDDDGPDLLARLRSPDGPQLLRAMQQHLALLESRLVPLNHQTQTEQSFAHHEAALQAVRAALDILKQLPIDMRDSRDGPLVNDQQLFWRTSP
jgi:hypothetical protein